jgi:Tol biopolymer transport system component
MRSVLLLLLAACGSDPALPDARPDVIVARCDPQTPFAAPVPVEGLNTVNDDVSARLSPDELLVVFARRTGTGPYDLFQATRASRDVAFETPTLLATVNSVNSEYWPSISPDGLLLVFSSDRSTAKTHIYSSRRASVGDKFGPPTIAPALMDLEDYPFLANGRALYFASASRSGGQGLSDIWRTEIDSTGATSAPVAVLGGVNTPDAEVTPAVTQDELRIIFRRTTGGELDIYTSSRSSMADGFGAATAVPGLATPGLDEVPDWISPDGCSLYVELRGPVGGMGGSDFYVARRGTP